MNSGAAEKCEGAVEISAQKMHARVGFRLVTREPLAGGPVELEFLVESLGPLPLRIAVSGDRAHQRPGQFSFAATFNGLPLEDPVANMPYLGGPAGVIEVSTSSPWHQSLILNQFIRLEHTLKKLANSAVGRLNVTCRRSLALGVTESAALSGEGAQILEVGLAFDLRRDDAALAALVARLFDEITLGPQSLRERGLGLLLSLRSVAYAQIEALTRHPDPSLAERARQALGISALP